nr:hypothetical protein [Candidatus Sigynarchaeota archaeon]
MEQQEITTQMLQSRLIQGDWEKIKMAWNDYKEGRKTMRDLLMGAAKELGKLTLRSLVSALTGGLVNIAIKRVSGG